MAFYSAPCSLLCSSLSPPCSPLSPPTVGCLQQTGWNSVVRSVSHGSTAACLSTQLSASSELYSGWSEQIVTLCTVYSFPWAQVFQKCVLQTDFACLRSSCTGIQDHDWFQQVYSGIWSSLHTGDSTGTRCRSEVSHGPRLSCQAASWSQCTSD